MYLRGWNLTLIPRKVVREGIKSKLYTSEEPTIRSCLPIILSLCQLCVCRVRLVLTDHLRSTATKHSSTSTLSSNAVNYFFPFSLESNSEYIFLPEL